MMEDSKTEGIEKGKLEVLSNLLKKERSASGAADCMAVLWRNLRSWSKVSHLIPKNLLTEKACYDKIKGREFRISLLSEGMYD